MRGFFYELESRPEHGRPKKSQFGLVTAATRRCVGAVHRKLEAPQLDFQPMPSADIRAYIATARSYDPVVRAPPIEPKSIAASNPSRFLADANARRQHVGIRSPEQRLGGKRNAQQG
jgi:hypothetical protein